MKRTRRLYRTIVSKCPSTTSSILSFFRFSLWTSSLHWSSLHFRSKARLNYKKEALTKTKWVDSVLSRVTSPHVHFFPEILYWFCYQCTTLRAIHTRKARWLSIQSVEFCRIPGSREFYYAVDCVEHCTADDEGKWTFIGPFLQI